MKGIEAINGITGAGRVNDVTGVRKTEDAGEKKVSFKSVLEGLINNVNETDNADKMANMELLTGDLDNIHDVIIAGEDADIALKLTASVRSKAIEAYHEIMRMQV